MSQQSSGAGQVHVAKRPPAAGRAGEIEAHHIDFIPPAERSGKPWGLGSFWFGANMVIVSVVYGGFLVAQGVAFGWSVLAIVVGFLLGVVLAAFHAGQGPTIGIPQMIQSRAQFGYVGAIVPMLVAMLTFITFFASTPSIAGLLANAAWGVNAKLLVVVVTIVTFFVALYGYHFSHLVAKYLSAAAIILFAIFTVLLLTHSGIPHPTASAFHGGFSYGFFLSGVALSFVFGAAYAVCIADYSRYLPENTSIRATVTWTYLGVFLSYVWLFLLGAYLATDTGFSSNILGNVIAITNSLSPVFTYIFTIVLLLALALQGSVSLYAGTNTILSIADSARMRSDVATPSVRTRLVVLVPFSGVCLAAALLYTGNFETYFTYSLDVLIILIMPWSAINLCDFYFVRHGEYETSEMFNPRGRYGVATPAGLISFFVAFGIEWLFANLGFYVSPVAKQLNGGDISWLVGIVIAGTCYLYLTRDLRKARRDALPLARGAVPVAVEEM